MFEYISRKTDTPTIAFYWGGVPFAILWLAHNSVWTAYLLQAYVITYFAFVLNPFEQRSEDLRKEWFWKVMLQRGLVIHALVLGALWLLDSAIPIIAIRSRAIFSVATVVGVVESIFLTRMVDRSRPPDSSSTTGTPNPQA